MEQRFAIYALIAPAAALFATFFIAPFVYFFVISFWQVRSYRLSPDFTIANYMKAATSYVSIGLLTIGVASAVALLSVVLALIYTGIIRFKAGRFGPFLLYVPLITMFGGYLVKIYAWKTILGNEGILNTALLGLGLIEQPITALLYSPGAVLVTLLYFLLPFAILPIYASMRGITDIELEAARDLGATGWRRLNDIIIPRCKHGLIAAFIVCFLLTVGDYVTPILVGGKVTLIGNLIAPQFGQYFNWPLGAAMSFLTLLAAAFMIVLFRTLLNAWQPR